jgi:hypothetical protein
VLSRAGTRAGQWHAGDEQVERSDGVEFLKRAHDARVDCVPLALTISATARSIGQAGFYGRACVSGPCGARPAAFARGLDPSAACA